MPYLPHPPQRPSKLSRSASVSGTPSGKSEVDVSSCPPQSTLWRRPWLWAACALIHLLILALYKLFTYLLPSILTSLVFTFLSIGLFRFQAGVVKRWPNLTLVFFVFILHCIVFRYRCMFAFAVLDLVFQYWAKTLAAKNIYEILKWSILCQVGYEGWTQSTDSDDVACSLLVRTKKCLLNAGSEVECNVWLVL